MARKSKIDEVLSKLEKLDGVFERLDRVDARLDDLDSKVLRQGVLLEEAQSQLRFVAEGVVGIRGTLDEKIDAKLEVVKLDVAVLKATAGVHGAQLNRLETRVDGIDTKVDRIDKRATTLEKKAG